MEPYYEGQGVTLFHGDCIKVLRQLPDCSVDSVVTDPPYGLEFMGKDWDRFGKPRDPRTAGRSGDGVQSGSAGIAKDSRTPQGRTGVAFGGGRPTTWRCDSCGKRDQFRAHSAKVPDCQGTWRLEIIDPDAPSPLLGFQLWSQEWAAEALRVLKPGGHLLAFGGTRTWHRLAVAIEDAGFEVRDSIAWLYGSGFPKSRNLDGGWQGWGTALKPAHEPIVVARKPLTGTVAANVLEHGTGALNIDGCRIGMSPEDRAVVDVRSGGSGGGRDGFLGDVDRLPGERFTSAPGGRWPANVVLDEDQAAALDQQSGYQKDGVAVLGNRQREYDASAYMIVDNREGNRTYGGGGGASRFFYVAKAPARERPKVDGVAHPTVKPLTLMRWLCRLVTPPGGIVLEPFAGSGTTVQAALAEGFRCIAVEREDDYLPLILSRLTSQEPDDGQLTLDASA